MDSGRHQSRLSDRETLVLVGNFIMAFLFVNLSPVAQQAMPFSLAVPIAGFFLLWRWQPPVAAVVQAVWVAFVFVLLMRTFDQWHELLGVLIFAAPIVAVILLISLGGRLLLRADFRSELRAIPLLDRVPPPRSTEPRTLTVDRAVWMRIGIGWSLAVLAPTALALFTRERFFWWLVGAAIIGCCIAVAWATQFAVEFDSAGILCRDLLGVRVLAWGEIEVAELRMGVGQWSDNYRGWVRLALVPRGGGPAMQISLKAIGEPQARILLERVRPWMRE